LPRPPSLSLHDALPISSPVLPGARLPPANSGANPSRRMTQQAARQRQGGESSPLTSRSPPSFQTWLDASADGISARAGISAAKRSEEHTSELQSRGHLV